VIATLGNAYGLAGRRKEAQAILNELSTRSRQTYVSAFYLALVYAGLGMRDQAMEQLEKAVEERQPYLAGLNVEPPFLGLHDDPRFQAIVRRIGIPTAGR
jgi:tetratricopeptide (TPR) repeat protein